MEHAKSRLGRTVNATEGRAAARADTTDSETRGSIKINLFAFCGPQNTHDQNSKQKKKEKKKMMMVKKQKNNTQQTKRIPLLL